MLQDNVGKGGGQQLGRDAHSALGGTTVLDVRRRGRESPQVQTTFTALTTSPSFAR
jgi:hypothetical protein